MIRRSEILIILVILGILSSACEKEDEKEELIATSIELVSGNNQTVQVLETLNDSVVVAVKDQNGQPFVGATVVFNANEGSVSEVYVITNTDGYARVQWTLGGTLGVQKLELTITGFVTNPVEINATGTQISVTDYDNNTYNAVVIGEQVWMAENLKVTHYADGEEVPIVLDLNANGTHDEWKALVATDKSYCHYKSDITDETEKELYGLLYTHAAATNGGDVTGQGICPTGWHLPSNEEWSTLFNSTNLIAQHAGRADLWTDDALNSSTHFNESGFSALPGRLRDNIGSYSSLGYMATWWSSNDDEIEYAKSYEIDHRNASGTGTYNKTFGVAVRCIRD